MSDIRRGEGRGADTALLPAVRSEDPGDPPTWTEATRFGALAPPVPAADDEDRAPEGAADWGATGNGNGGGPGHDGGSGGGSGPDGPGGPGGFAAAPSGPKGRAVPWWRAERLMPKVLHGTAFIPLLALGFIVVALVIEAIPAIRVNGLKFFTTDTWAAGNFYAPLTSTHGVAHPPGASYGALDLIVGTIESSVIALCLAVPIGVGTALIVVEKLPPRLSNGVGFCLEVLAGIPSVIFGLWGFLTFGPFLSHTLAPIADRLPDVPVLRFFRGPTGSGQNLLTTSLVLTIMILPILAATTRDLLRQVPRATVEGAIALGMTDSEAMRAVTFRWVRPGVIGASVLGLGRALGETMAVAMVSGVLLGQSAHSVWSQMNTIAAAIVTQLDSAFTDASGFALKTLAELGLVLVVITLIANVGARMLVRKVSGTALPVGRGV
jgi:phosphate transport system permease protein